MGIDREPKTLNRNVWGDKDPADGATIELRSRFACDNFLFNKGSRLDAGQWGTDNASIGIDRRIELAGGGVGDRRRV